MDNPNPIYYRDLITPDNAITELISQLQTLITKYDEVKGKIQSDAAAMAQSLNNVTSATEAQRAEIDRVTKESDRLAQQYARTTNAEREAYRALQEATRAKKEQQQIDKLIVQLNNSAEGSYNRLSAQYRLNKIRLNEMSEAERHGTEAGRQLEAESRRIYERMSELQKATGKYTLEVGHYENAMRALPAPLRTLTDGFKGMSSSLQAIGASDLPLGAKALKGFSTVMLGTVGIVLQFVNYLTSAARTMREFEQANADLSTILGVNVKDMKALTDSALSLGRTTEYTAAQVTQLQTELAKLGFGQGSIISMQKSVLQFATAVGANLGEAAEVAGSALRAFNLTSKDTDDVLATLAVATNKSALSFARIRESVGTVFPVANAYGLTVKDTAALLGALANAGFDASSAATALRNILLNMADANGKLAKSLGGSVGTFDEIISGMIELRKRGIDVAEALELTDKRSVAAFTAFLSGAESARELRESLEDVSGELERIQSERLNTVEGSTKLLASAWEGLTLAFNKSNGAMKSTIDWLTRLITKTQQALFPVETFVSDTADKYTRELQDYYAKNGAEAAKQYIESYRGSLEKLSDDAAREYRNAPILNKWFGDNKYILKAATGSLTAFSQAADVVLTQIDNDVVEAQKQADLAAEKAAQDAENRQKELTEKEKKAAQKAENERKKAEEKAKKQRIADLKAVVEAINLEISTTEKGTDKMLQLRIDKVNAERAVELEQNRQKVETERQDEKAINAKYDKAVLDEKKAYAKEVSNLRVQSLQGELDTINLQVAVTREGTQEMLNLRIAALEKRRAIELEKNSQATKEMKQEEKKINAKYDRLIQEETLNFHMETAMELLDIQQELAESEFNLLDRNERQKSKFRLQQERESLRKELELNRQNGKELTEEQRTTIENQIKAINKELKSLGYNNIYEVLGLSVTKQQQDALDTWKDSALDGINEIIDAFNQMADAAVTAANARVEAAQSALDAEIEARNNGYANNVIQAQKELELEKQQQQKALEQKIAAQKAQAAIDSVTQASSLITASANIWASLSPIPVVGPGLAIAALATMWASFAYSKVKAFQVAENTEQYGDGTVELLQGGSHASGNDIDLGRKPDGTRRRAEGGEYFAVINKRNSRRYGGLIPDVINALNDGTFTDKYQRANASLSGIALAMVGDGGTDVSAIERDVRQIREQGARARFVDGDGNTVIVYKNLKQTILKS